VSFKERRFETAVNPMRPAATLDGDFKSPLLEVFRRFHASGMLNEARHSSSREKILNPVPAAVDIAKYHRQTPLVSDARCSRDR
jgi:hypothetical protein